MTRVLVYTNSDIPGRFVFVDPDGNEDSLLVSPRNTYRLTVRQVLHADPQVVWVSESGPSTPSPRKKGQQEEGSQ